MLGVAQTLAWASSYYIPAVLAGPMGAEFNVSPSTIFGAFSVALLVSAATGPWAGRAIDRFGGRPVLVASNLVFAAGLAGLALSSQVLHVFAAWVLLGVGMGSGLYEAAFATAVRLHGRDARGVITGITLLGGLASTVGWPLSALLAEIAGWRGACLAWAGLHLVLGLPLNALLPPPPSAHAIQAEDGKAEQGRAAALSAAEQRRAAWIMAYVFAVSWFVSTAMAAHLPRLLVAGGATLALAVSIAALVGPAQVAGRLIEFSLLRRAHPLLSARLATLAHPLGALCLGLFGMQAATAFAVLHGLGNGILTIAIGTLPLLVFGPQGYGQRQGLLMVPARIVQAGAPFLFGLALEHWGAGALWLSTGLALSACAALLAMKLPQARQGRPTDPAPVEDAAGSR
ncbi:multidrug efflux system protein MdtL [Variovorax sp. PBL-H6]|uniref:MFS transporter n=1 Tax=Variovorax sp. PBL-H6 TaxID=434009 RepID=UPI00131667FB|nr:multidrug efflux system protein MdtL [Variovorax sp. PBL-H6]